MTTITYDTMQNIEAIASFNGKTLITSEDYLDLKAYEHALAFTVAKIADQDMLTEVHKAMKQAVESGMTFHDFKKRLKPYLMVKGWLVPAFKNDNVDDDKEAFKAYNKHLGHRLKTIYHTNKQTAYAAGQWERIQQTKEFLPYLQYMPSLSERQRDEHRRYYHLVRPVDDPIWQSIFPPNGFGCKCWVKQLTRRQAQKIGITPDDDSKAHIEWVDYQNPKTGEVSQVPKGITPSFSHNHDRLTAMLKLAEEKHGAEFGERLKGELGEFILDLIVKPNFTRDLAVVTSQAFVERFNQLSAIIKNENGNRENSLELRKKYAKGENYAVATISPNIQEALGSQTAIVWLSDDTVIKMLAHHPEMDLLPIFKDAHLIMKNARLITKENDTHISYFQVGEHYYKATIKVTQDKTELYLLTVFNTNEKEIKRVLKKADVIVNNLG